MHMNTEDTHNLFIDEEVLAITRMTRGRIYACREITTQFVPFHYSSLYNKEQAARTQRAAEYHRQYMAKRLMIKGRTASNLAINNLPSHRWNNDAILARRARDFGRNLAVAIASGDHYEILRALCTDEEWAVDLLSSSRCPEILEENFHVCPKCGSIVTKEDSSWVMTSESSQSALWCSSCVDSHATVCNNCGILWSTENTYDVSSGSTICPNCYSNDYFTCDDCGDVYHNDEYAGEGLCQSCYRPSHDDDGLADYHDEDRDWETLHEKPDFPYDNAPPVGIELEVYSESRAKCVEALRDLEESTAYPSPLILERDSSLSDEYGFEVITHPMGLYEHQQYAPALLKTLLDHGGRGWDARGGMYGIHISVSRTVLSSLQEARLMMFLSAYDNVDFVQAIAQRADVYNARLNIGQLGQKAQTISQINPDGFAIGYHADKCGRRKKVKKISGVGKYSPLNFKPDLAEFRIFQSTLNQQAFLKNIEFVFALLEWTRPESATGSRWFYKEFLTWLKHRLFVRKHYPNLIGYLERDTFSVKGRKAITNQWKEYLPKKDEKVMPELQSAQA